jgi:hypothetical protein
MNAITSELSTILAARAKARFDSRESAQFAGESVVSWRQVTREELGLPLDRPIIMTGHQAGIWHAGIAEKFVRGAEIAALCGGALVHVVIDHDTNDASLIAFPALVDGQLERLMLERSPVGRGPNVLRRPIRTMRPERAHQTPPSIESALQEIESAVQGAFRRENLAMQMAHAANVLLGARARIDATVAATSFARTSLAAAMRREFALMRGAYNHALEGQRIARLGVDELPFWRLDRADSSRLPLLSSDNTPNALLAPRALALTAIARMGACDLFIHGTGGGKYDGAMEAWMSAVLKVDSQQAIAPMTVVTATRLAPLAQFIEPFEISATPRALSRLEQDPFADAGVTKAQLLGRIVGSRLEKRAAFVVMRRAIEAARKQRAVEINALRARLGANARALRTHALATDRTWPFPFSMTYT